ncbi:MAG: helix-turn-helix transcriptional regulator [Steroidobacteraceae bacterium]
MAVRDARSERGLTQGELAELAGLATLTVNRVENGRALRPTSLAALDRSLGWTSGSAQSILSGGSATLKRDTEPRGDQTADERADVGALAAMLLSTWQDDGYTAFREARAELRQRLSPEMMRSVTTRFTDMVEHVNVATGGAPEIPGQARDGL